MIYDSIIIGGGPAGLTAGIYLARAGFKVLILEKETIGGQIASAPMVENYPGFMQISGSELASNMYDQVEALGVTLEIENVRAIQNGKLKKVFTDENEYQAKTVIVATGSKHRQLGLKMEEKFLGSGIHFCVSCDGAFYKDKTVAVIGGANTAVTNALYLAEIATKVYLICIEEEPVCEKELLIKIKAKTNVEIISKTTVENFDGEEELESITIKNSEGTKTIKVDGVFEAIGMSAQTDLVNELLDRNEANYIVSENCETALKGIYVAGDCREKGIRQLTTAIADGTTAAYAAINFLRG